MSPSPSAALASTATYDEGLCPIRPEKPGTASPFPASFCCVTKAPGPTARHCLVSPLVGFKAAFAAVRLCCWSRPSASCNAPRFPSWPFSACHRFALRPPHTPQKQLVARIGWPSPAVCCFVGARCRPRAAVRSATLRASHHPQVRSARQRCAPDPLPRLRPSSAFRAAVFFGNGLAPQRRSLFRACVRRL
ncbi:hypothetical protein TRVL_04768 [Trypanosoma vivax]|nr:hypothetical protein TRVL_04768 [Trypanosoma vivax]